MDLINTENINLEEIFNNYIDIRDYIRKYKFNLYEVFERYTDIKEFPYKRINSLFIKDVGIDILLDNYKKDIIYFYEIFDTGDVLETPIKIDIHRGYLEWRENSNILDGCPLIVDGDFDCDSCDLTLLIGCPIVVTGWFSCSFNSLTSLKYCPVYVGKSFYCYNNYLTDLQYVPKNINGYDNFICSNNNLTTLKYAPEKVNGVFDCRCNPDLPLEEIERYRNSGSVEGRVIS